jgi:hypothetical protein
MNDARHKRPCIYCVIPFIQNVQKRQIYRDIKMLMVSETEWYRELLLIAYRFGFLFREIKIFWN